jgi:KaiC/GvpD/RAD55 family RecA-like ATPase
VAELGEHSFQQFSLLYAYAPEYGDCEVILTVDRVPTGILGLDKMIEGGIPKGRIIILVGGPGTGKTIFSMQFLVNGITKYGQNGIFASLEENKKHIYQAMERFSWNLADLEKSGKFTFLDASPIRRSPGDVKVGKYIVGRRDFSMLGLINTVEQLAESEKAERIVVDPLATLMFQYPDTYDRRNAYLDLIESLSATGATCITTMEVGSSEFDNPIEEEFLSSGVISLQSKQIGKALARVLRIKKMRVTAADVQPRPYKIDSSGITVFAEETVF